MHSLAVLSVGWRRGEIPVARGDQQGILILIAPTTAQWSVRIEAYAAATKGNVRLPVRTLGHETRL
jgi:hypothetical protein